MSNLTQEQIEAKSHHLAETIKHASEALALIRKDDKRTLRLTVEVNFTGMSRYYLSHHCSEVEDEGLESTLQQGGKNETP